jgi:penicillin-binding protein 1A
MLHGSRYFVDWVLAQTSDFVSFRDRDIVVTTTIDPHLQRLAESKIAKVLDGPGARADASQAALVAMTPNGAVRAMVGGRTYTRSQFNRAVQAYRQPGSAFKPVVYLAGIEAGLGPETRMIDAPIDVNGWRPRNFSGKYRGDVSVRQGLAQSINTVAVRVSERAGRRRVIDVARRLGITAKLQPTPSLALGAIDVSVIEMTAAYAVFANGGIGVWPYGIEAIHDTEGQLLYARSGSGPGRVASPEHISALTEMLVAVVESGTGRGARLARPAAGKTGTSQNYRDAWFVGFTSELVTGVWMGNDNGRPMKKVTGGRLPAQLWQAFMFDAHAGKPAKPLPSLIPWRQRETVVAGNSPQHGEPVTAGSSAPADSPSFWQRMMRVFDGDRRNDP